MKMAVLTSSDFMNIDVIEGRDATIEFTVQNKSSLAWPFKPFVQNEKDKSVKQHVDAILQPGQQTTVRYVFRAPLKKDQANVHMLLQLVEPKDYQKFCESTIVVICNVQSSQAEESIELGFSKVLHEDARPARNSDIPNIDGNSELFGNTDSKKNEAILQMIDSGIEQYRASNMYDEQSIDDARSMVESLQQQDANGQRLSTEGDQDDIINQTAALLDSLKQSAAQVNEVEEETKRQQRQAAMADLDGLFNKTNQFR